ncbi:MAG: zinc-binding dehydrogenase, partial [Parahaliea sp.]
MNAATYSKFGTPEQVVSTQSIGTCEPGAGEIRIRMQLSPVHNHDVLTIRGEYGYQPELPATGGSEALGIVDSVGQGVEHFAIGDRVNVVAVNGAWAETFIAPAANAAKMPTNVPDELAAQLTAMPFSAVMALNALKAERGDWILVNAANGAVGKTIAQVAASRGVNVANIVRSQTSRQTLLDLGFEAVFTTSDTDWTAQIQSKIGGARVAAAVDMVGGTAANDLLTLLSERSVLLVFGQMDDRMLQLNGGTLIYKEVSVQGFWGSAVFQHATTEELSATRDELVELAATGLLQLPVAATYPLDKVSQAMAAYEGERDGKIFIS